MTAAFEIPVVDFAQTDGAATGNMGQFEIPPDSVCLVHVQVFAVRESDLATRGWSLEALVKRAGSGSVQVQETIPAGTNVFGSAADVTALSGVSIAVFADSMFLGVACSGQANDLIFWSVRITGRRITL